MKKIFIIHILLAIPLLAWCDNITFADAEVKAICVKNWDTNGDGELSKEEAATVKDLGDVFNSNKSIKSFDEFQYFKGISIIGSRTFGSCSGLTSITIPSSVISIGADAFNGCLGLTSITIPSSVTSIADGAFYACSGLTSITIPNSVTSIGEAAFEYCLGLTSIIIPSSVTSIGEFAFAYCSGLTSITIPSSVTSIGNGFFYECSSLTSIIIPSSVTSIGNNAFSRCSSLKSITIPNSVTSIGGSAFGLCTSLTNIIIPNSVTTIGSSAFYGCTGLTSFTIPNSVTEIHMQAFQNCTSLTSIAIPNGVKQINHYTFAGCTALTSVTIPNSMTRFGPYVFQNCSSLTSITIPNSVTEIEGPVFDGCSKLISVKVEMTNPVSIVAKTFSNRANATLYVPKGSKAVYQAADYWKEFKEIVEYEVDENINFADAEVKAICVKNWDTNGDGELSKAEAAAVTDIGTVFKRNTSIKSFDELQYFTGLTSLGSSAFSDCSGLTSITIPNSVTSLGSSAFSDCSGLTSITIPNSVTSIGSNAFQDCSSLTNITIPSSVTSIGLAAFNGCSGITSMTIPKSVTLIEGNILSKCSNLTSIKVESGNTKYDSRNNCNAIIETSTNTLIQGCKTTIIPNSVIRLGKASLGGFSGLTSITIPSSVKTIDDYAFTQSGLKTVTIPETVTSLGFGAFMECKNLESVTIYTETIYSYAFYDCYSLTSVIIGNSVKAIANNAFNGCHSLSSITIPNSVTVIGNEAFGACGSLIKVKVEIATPVAIILDDFSNRSNATLYVPKGCKAAYQAADYWKEFKTILEFPDTDVNQDGATDVVDVVDIARFVVGSPSDSFHEFLADLNSDDKVNVADAVVLVNDIAGNTSFAKAWHRMQSSDDAQEQLMLTKNKDNSLSLSMDNSRAYTAFQFDLMLNSDMNVMQMLLNESRKNGHQLLYNKVCDGHYRVVALSTANNSFNGKNGELLNIQLDGFDTDDLTIHNVHFFTGQGNDYAFDDLKLQGGTTTINELPLVDGDQPAAVYDLQGRKQPTLRRGVNIINGKKVIIK